MNGRLTASLQAAPPQESENLFATVPQKFIKSKAPIQKSQFLPSILCSVKDINLSDKDRIFRGGIIFYTFIDGEIFLCFGRDVKTGDITDFGGRRESKESIIECAIREGQEESRFLISSITEESVQECKCIYNTTSTSASILIIFVPIVSNNPNVDIIKSTKHNFTHKINLTEKQKYSHEFNEMEEVVWLSERDADYLFSYNQYGRRGTNKIYTKVRKCIMSIEKFSIETLKDSLKTVNTTY